MNDVSDFLNKLRSAVSGGELEGLMHEANSKKIARTIKLDKKKFGPLAETLKEKDTKVEDAEREHKLAKEEASIASNELWSAIEEEYPEVANSRSGINPVTLELRIYE